MYVSRGTVLVSFAEVGVIFRLLNYRSAVYQDSETISNIYIINIQIKIMILNSIEPLLLWGYLMHMLL